MMRATPFLRTVVMVLLGVLLAGALPAAAQDAPASGLTVTGRGDAQAPADRATLQLIIGNPNYAGPPFPQAGEIPGERERETVAPIVDALIEAGVPEDGIEVIVGPGLSEIGTYFGPALAIILVEVADPEAQQLSDLVNVANGAAADERLVIGRTNVVFAVEDCAPLEREARASAVADAREQASVMAGLAGVSTGDVTGVRVLAPETPQGAYVPYGIMLPSAPQSCDLEDLLTNPSATFLLPSFSPDTEPEVIVSVAVEMTFAITGSAQATPAP